MKIYLSCPSLNPHGGVRVIVEWANHLARRGHHVDFHVFQYYHGARWIEIDDKVNLLQGTMWQASDHDIVIATTPQLALQLKDIQVQGDKYFFLQMAEELFQPSNKHYVKMVQDSYNVPFPIIGISGWVERHIRRLGRKGAMHYIGNGVSTHFQPGKKDKGLTILVEGWEGYNAAKDVDYIGPRVAEYLQKKYNAHIIAYSQHPCTTMPHVPNEYYQQPNAKLLVRLYQRATFMIKATKYDARSCAPMEAMACGTVTVRGIDKGDDDLRHMINCLETGYSYEQVKNLAQKLIENPEIRRRLEKNGLEYRDRFLSWDYWMKQVTQIFNGANPDWGDSWSEFVAEKTTSTPAKFWSYES